MNSNKNNYSQHSSQYENLTADSIEKIELSKKEISVWENHMKTFCSGRESAFRLSSELILDLGNSDNLHILDIACGYGGWSDFLHQASKAKNINIEFTGMDESVHRLQVYQDILGDSANTIQGNILNTLPALDDGKFDASLLGWAAHEIQSSQLEQIYSSINHILKPGGILLIADFVSGLIPEVEALSIQLNKKIRESLMADPETRQQEEWLKDINKHHTHNHSQHHHGEHPRHKHHYSVKEHLNFLNNAGFSTTEEIWRYMNSSMILAIK